MTKDRAKLELMEAVQAAVNQYLSSSRGAHLRAVLARPTLSVLQLNSVRVDDESAPLCLEIKISQKM